jgi:hypothetical protein
MGAAATAAGVPRTLEQAMQCLQQLKDTPLVHYAPDLMRRAAGIGDCVNHRLTAHAMVGRLSSAMEQEMFVLLKLICDIVVQLLRQVPAAAATLKQQHAAHATTESGVRSNISHTGNGSNSSGSSGASTSDIELDDLFVMLVSALSRCDACLGKPLKVVRAYKEAGEHLALSSQPFDHVLLLLCQFQAMMLYDPMRICRK